MGDETIKGSEGEEGDVRPLLTTDLDGSFERVVREYQGRLYRFALRYSASPQDAEEIVQDAFVRAYEALGRYEAARVRELSLTAWLYQIALNVARNRARKKQAPQISLSADPHDGDGGAAFPGGREPQDDAREGPEGQMDRAQGEERLAALLATLPERYKTALLLRYVEDLSYEEAAAVTKRPVGTMKSDVHRGLALLREALVIRQGEVS